MAEVNSKQNMRLDKALVVRGVVKSRSRARELIGQGSVAVNDQMVKQPDYSVRESDAVTLLKEDIPWVSRAGIKLEHALHHFSVDVQGKVVLDVGASTGGFTDVLLVHGASRIYALDVGHGQLDKKFINDSHVINMEGKHISSVNQEDFPVLPEIAVVDVSFISLEKVFPDLLRILNTKALLIALIKPQFEVGRDKIKKGIVKDATLHSEVLARIRKSAEEAGFSVVDIIPSPILGGDGNKEFLLFAQLSSIPREHYTIAN